MPEKKEIPLPILEIARIITAEYPTVKQIRDSKHLLSLKDIDPKSKFYFTVLSQNITSGGCHQTWFCFRF